MYFPPVKVVENKELFSIRKFKCFLNKNSSMQEFKRQEITTFINIKLLVFTYIFIWKYRKSE